jgi:hypothetical protein
MASPEEVIALIEQSGCPVAKAVLAEHMPSYYVTGQAYCGEIGDPFEDPDWPCSTINAVVTALKEGHR